MMAHASGLHQGMKDADAERSSPVSAVWNGPLAVRRRTTPRAHRIAITDQTAMSAVHDLQMPSSGAVIPDASAAPMLRLAVYAPVTNVTRFAKYTLTIDGQGLCHTDADRDLDGREGRYR